MQELQIVESSEATKNSELGKNCRHNLKQIAELQYINLEWHQSNGQQKTICSEHKTECTKTASRNEGVTPQARMLIVGMALIPCQTRR